MSELTAHKPHIWASVEVWYENWVEEFDPGANPQPLPDVNRGSWFCPCVSIYDAERTIELCDTHGIERIVDLGAGDFRFSLYADRKGYDVIAFETLDSIVESVTERFDMGDIEIRQSDYYAAFDDLISPKTAMCCFGGTNKLPEIPEQGFAVQGYLENGVTVWNAGTKIDEWELNPHND